MKKIILILALAVGIVAALSAFEGMGEHQGKGFQNCRGMQENMGGRQHGMMNNQHGMGNGLGWMLDELELTDAQQEQIEDLQIAHKKVMIQLDADLDMLKVDQHVAMQDHDFKELKKLTGKIFDHKKNIAIKQVEHQEAIWNVLTPEQQAKADELKKDKPHFRMQKNMKVMDEDGMGMQKHKRLMLGTE